MGVCMCVSIVHSKHYKYYSVISSCNSEWVLFNCAQVLPCYVIEVRFDGHGTVKPSQPLPLQPVQGDKDEEESEVERKKRLLARVRLGWGWRRSLVAGKSLVVMNHNPLGQIAGTFYL